MNTVAGADPRIEEVRQVVVMWPNKAVKLAPLRGASLPPDRYADKRFPPFPPS